MEPLKGRELRQPVLRVDVDGPGEVTRIAVQLLIEEVAPAPDCLCQDETRGANVQPAQRIQSLPLRIDDQADGAPDDGAEYPETSPSYDEARILHVEAPLVDDMVQAGGGDPPGG